MSISEAVEAPALRNLVGGRWVDAVGSGLVDDVDPATGTILARVPLSAMDDVDRAVQAASFAARVWRETSPLERARALIAVRATLDEHRDELAELVTTDMGKTLPDARAEVGRGIESVEAAIGAPHLLKGESLHGIAAGLDVNMQRQPLGIVAAITPFNFPAMIPLWFVPFSIACGNAIIVKPSEADPRPAARIAELIDAIDEIPPGLVNVVHGAHAAVDALLDHPGIAAISFVGSAATARYVAQRAVANGKRVQALGGAKNSMVVMPDAPPDLTARRLCASAFGAAGQRCLAGSVALLVGTRREQDASRELIVEAARRLRVGPGDKPDTDVCPLVSRAARERVGQEIDEAVLRGATLALDGRRSGGKGGAELGPTILEDLRPEDRTLREELFGPVLALHRVATLAEAIQWTNRNRYGNAAVIFTASGAAAREFADGIHAGMVGVNVGVAAPIAWFPFSGWGDSMEGDLHANGRDAIEFYTRKKVVTSQWP
jgi:malonate-semialdehyde dehydrogenase (acetylating) / methylmalonate-semialdehyde dehydrogenase